MFSLRSTLLGFAATAALLASGAVGEEPAKERGPRKPLPGPYVHVALYSFKADAPAGIAEEYAAEAEKTFRKIGSIRGYRIGAPAKLGTPALWTVRPDASYAVGTILTFEDFDGLAEYGNHPRHNELKKKYGKYFEEIVVYDFETPPAKDANATAAVEAPAEAAVAE